MYIHEAAVDSGIDSGLIRALRGFSGFIIADPQKLRPEIGNLVRTALQGFEPSRPWGARGQFTYAELGAMAVAARMHFQEAALTAEAAREFTEALARFLNSWLHE